jgi:hypothetical protein
MSVKSNRYDSQEHLDNFIKTGTYPKIHDDICILISNCADEQEPFIDIGCSIGLLSHRLVTKVKFSESDSLDMNKVSLDKAVKHKNIHYHYMPINLNSLDLLGDLIYSRGSTLAVCRRVLPEIWEYGGDELITKFVETLYKNGINKIALEGRKQVKNPTNKLYNIEKEVNACSEYYKLFKSYKECALIVKR